MKTNTILCGDIREIARELPDQSVHCIVTSPPYLGLRDYGVENQIGLEETPEAYVETMVGIFRELRRVLRDDGSIWLNLGDSYAANRPGGQPIPTNTGNKNGHYGITKVPNGLKPKDLIGIPWRVALALQADGYYLRSDIIWSKPNPMPESVTDRPTKAHEYIFLLSKSERYYYDQEAVREANAPVDWKRAGKNSWQSRYRDGKALLSENSTTRQSPYLQNGGAMVNDGHTYNPNGRNRRTVWTISTTPFKDAHFAVFPPDLIRPCILAGCPAKVCAECGKPWERVVEKESSFPTNKRNGHPVRYGDTETKSAKGYGMPSIKTSSKTLGFAPACDCNAATVPGVVLDPFIGSGTVAEVAIETGRNYLGVELNPEYIELAKKRIAKARPALLAPCGNGYEPTVKQLEIAIASDSLE